MSDDDMNRLLGSNDFDEAEKRKKAELKHQEDEAKTRLKVGFLDLFREKLYWIPVILSWAITIFLCIILSVFCYIVWQYISIQLESPKDFLVFCDKLFVEIQSFFGAFSLGAIAVGILTNKLSDRIK